MLDFEELLLAEQKNPNATILEFVNGQYNANEALVFVEGVNDPQFYYDFLKDYLPNDEFRFFNCGGKRSLIQVKDFVSNYTTSTKPSKILYLTDLDFDWLLQRRVKDVFRTKYYSIESYFSHHSYIEYLINKFVPTIIKKGVKTKIINLIKADMSEFATYMIAPMAALCAIRNKGSDANFDKLNVSILFNMNSFDQAIKTQRNRFQLIGETLKVDTAEIDVSEMLVYTRKMRAMDYRYWLRGKIALQLLKLCVRRAAARVDAAFQQALNIVISHIGTPALTHGQSYLRDLPELRSYIASI